MTDDERTEGEEEEGLFSFAFRIYVLFVVTKSRAIFIQRRKTLVELAKNLTKNSSNLHTNHKQARRFRANYQKLHDDE